MTQQNDLITTVVVDDEPDNMSTLATAPQEVQLAVDLIMLLESNNIDSNIALKALDIVKADLENKKHG